MLIVLPSMTTAVRIKKMLAARGIAAQVVPGPKVPQNKGCGFAIEVRDEYLGTVEKAAWELGSKITGVYKGGGP